MAVVRRRDDASGTVTLAVVPLKNSALPYFPAVLHAAVPIVPGLPLSELSVAVVPTPSSNEYAATSSGIVASVVSAASFE